MRKTRLALPVFLLVVTLASGLVLILVTGDGAPRAAEEGTRTAAPVSLKSKWFDVPLLTLESPCAHILESAPSDDYEVHYISCIGENGWVTGSGIGIYVGYFPISFRSEAKGKVTSKKGLVGGRKIKWYTWKDQVKGDIELTREGILKQFFRKPGREMPPDLEELRIQIWMYARSLEELDELESAVATLSPAQ